MYLIPFCICIQSNLAKERMFPQKSLSNSSWWWKRFLTNDWFGSKPRKVARLGAGPPLLEEEDGKSRWEIEIHQNQFRIHKNLFKIHQRNSWHPSKKCPIDFHHFQGPWRTWDANSSWWRREGGDHSLNLLKKNPRLSGNYLRAIRAFLLTVPTAERVSKRLEKSFSVPWISWRFHNCPTLRDLF